MGKIFEIASHETFYDSIKWVVFGIFAVIYFGIKDKFPFSAIVFIILFVLILFFINIIKQRDFIKIKNF